MSTGRFFYKTGRNRFRGIKIKNPGVYSGVLVARAGFEPTQSEPKSEVLPLDDRAIAGAKVRNLMMLAKFFHGLRKIK